MTILALKKSSTSSLEDDIIQISTEPTLPRLWVEGDDLRRQMMEASFDPAEPKITDFNAN